MPRPLADEGIVVHRVLRTEIGDYNVQRENTEMKRNTEGCRENNRLFQMLNDSVTIMSNKMSTQSILGNRLTQRIHFYSG